MKRPIVATLLVLSLALRLLSGGSDRTCVAYENAGGTAAAGMGMSMRHAQPSHQDPRGAPCDRAPNAATCAAMAVCATTVLAATSSSVALAPRALQTVAPSSPLRPHSLTSTPEPPPPRA